MADNKCMVDALNDLVKDEVGHLKYILNTITIKGETIPKGKLENADAVKIAQVLNDYHPRDSMEVLIEALDKIPKKDLVLKLRNLKAAEEKKKSELPNDVMDGVPAKQPGICDLAPKLGKYKLSDLEKYAMDYRDQLINQLSLKLSSMSELKDQLGCRELKKRFLFTAEESYKLFTNQELSVFLKEDPRVKKSQTVPKKILDLLFFPLKSNGKGKEHTTAS